MKGWDFLDDIDCKDCGDRGVLYDENGNTTNCPCHYL